MLIEAPRLRLRPVVAADVTDRYVSWLNDPEVGRFLETRFTPHTHADVLAYVAAQESATDSLFLAILQREGDRHIGNLRIGAIDRRHDSATIALVIGERTAWGQGFGSEAIAAATRHAFDALGLRKLNARCYANNFGSIRAFEKAGWRREGLQRSQFETPSGRVDGVWLGIVRSE